MTKYKITKIQKKYKKQNKFFQIYVLARERDVSFPHMTYRYWPITIDDWNTATSHTGWPVSVSSVMFA